MRVDSVKSLEPKEPVQGEKDEHEKDPNRERIPSDNDIEEGEEEESQKTDLPPAMPPAV